MRALFGLPLLGVALALAAATTRVHAQQDFPAKDKTVASVVPFTVGSLLLAGGRTVCLT